MAGYNPKCMAKEFKLVAGHVALDFANTLDNRYDPGRLTELLPAYEDFLAFVRQAGILNAQQARKLLRETDERDAGRALERVIELREALYFLFRSVATGEPPERSNLRTLNRFLAGAQRAELIVWDKNGFARAPRDFAESPEAPLWPVVEAAATLLTSPEGEQVRECSARTCRWLFLDQSKNHTRRWCDMRVCGNRSKAKRFYARLSAGG
jgi:predicted RNA-binding Zn ribbon-like protein